MKAMKYPDLTGSERLAPRIRLVCGKLMGKALFTTSGHVSSMVHWFNEAACARLAGMSHRSDWAFPVATVSTVEYPAEGV